MANIVVLCFQTEALVGQIGYLASWSRHVFDRKSQLKFIRQYFFLYSVRFFAAHNWNHLGLSPRIRAAHSLSFQI